MREGWQYGPTGDMTLAVTDEAGRRILRIDMLAQETMRAGTSGDRLARALNDLCLLAALPRLLGGGSLPDLPHPDAGVSPAPWSLSWNQASPRVKVRDATGKLIAGYAYPSRTDPSWLRDTVATLEGGILALNRACAAAGQTGP